MLGLFDYSMFRFVVSINGIKNAVYPERLLEITLARNVANAAVSIYAIEKPCNRYGKESSITYLDNPRSFQ